MSSCDEYLENKQLNKIFEFYLKSKAIVDLHAENNHVRCPLQSTESNFFQGKSKYKSYQIDCSTKIPNIGTFLLKFFGDIKDG